MSAIQVMMAVQSRDETTEHDARRPMEDETGLSNQSVKLAVIAK